MTSLFGPFIDPEEIEQAAKTTLVAWIPTYLREIERVKELDQGALSNPRSYVTISEAEPDWKAEDQLPVVLLLSPGTEGVPQRQGDGGYSASWALAVGVVASARDQEATRRLVRMYGLAVRTILVQKGSLGIRAKTHWQGERHSDLNPESSRTIAIHISEFLVEIDDVANAFGGPSAPAPDLDPDSPEWPEIQTADVTVEATEDP